MKGTKGPFPAVAFNEMIAANVMPPLVGTISGEVTASKNGVPLGAARFGGKVSDVWLSVGGSGRDDSNTLSIAANIKINGTTCLTTQPAIAGNNGSASEQKTTKVTGDTGVTQAVISASANSVTPGDVISCDWTVVRTASPTTEISNAMVFVEFEPAI